MSKPRPEPVQAVLVSELADYLGIQRRLFRDRIKYAGYTMLKIHDPETGLLVNAVSPEDAKKIITEERLRPTIVRPEDLA